MHCCHAHGACSHPMAGRARAKQAATRGLSPNKLHRVQCLSQPPVTEATQTHSTSWHALGKPMLWAGNAEEAVACDRNPRSPLCDPALPPLWRVFVLSDGSVTRHLQILTGYKVQVDCLSMVNIGEGLEGLPPGTDIIQGPRVQRQVLLRTGPEHVPLVYASSWWNADEVDKYLTDKSKPIWVSLSQDHVELYREVQVVYHGHNEKLEELLECKGPFWGRHYIFWHNKRPLTLIYEVFSNKLQSVCA